MTALPLNLLARNRTIAPRPADATDGAQPAWPGDGRAAPATLPATVHAPAGGGAAGLLRLRGLAGSAVALGRIDDAWLVLAHARAAWPDDADLLADSAALALRRDDAPSALALARAALRQQPLHAGATFTLAVALRASGDVAAARDCFDRLAAPPLAGRLHAESPGLGAVVDAMRALDAGAAGRSGPDDPGGLGDLGDDPPAELAELAELAATAAAAAAPAPATAKATAVPATAGPRHTSAADGAAADIPATPVCTLPLAARFDLLAKLLYVLHRRGQLPAWVGTDVPALYARHIQLRTGGVEPGDPVRKPTLAAYVEQFDALIDDMAVRGFDPAQPVLLARDGGLPHDGAHRLAAALALGVPAALRSVDAPGHRWDLGWFERHGFLAGETDALLQTWARLRGDAACVSVLWSAAEAHWPALEASLGEAMTPVGARTVELPRAAFEEMVRDVYAIDGGPRAGPAIERKIELLRAWPARVRVVFSERRPDTPPAAEMKRRLRDALDAVLPAAWFVTLHIAADALETRHLLDLYANRNNLARLRRRRALPAAFVQRLVDLQRELTARGICSHDVCVVGGSVLAVLGLRDSDDIDFTLLGDERRRRFDDRNARLAPGVDLVTRNYPRSFGTAAAPDDDALIRDPRLHFRVRGIRFADPRIVLERKQQQRREKDLRDLPLLAAFLET